jgi:6-phosphogluconolactonase
MKIHQFPDAEGLAIGTAEFICELALDCIQRNNRFHWVLSGGSTPASCYQQLVRVSETRGIDWSKVQVYWGDERCVPPDHDQSNYRMARQTLFDHIAIPVSNLHRMACENDPAEAARKYEALLRSHFPDQTSPGFDLILLGLGEDGHTASLFPSTEILNERERWVAPVYVPHLDSWRISLTLPAINAASVAAFLVAGSGKASILKAIFDPYSQPRYPAHQISPVGSLYWFIDQAAGRDLDTGLE